MSLSSPLSIPTRTVTTCAHPRATAEIIILDSLITVYKNSADVWLYVVRHMRHPVTFEWLDAGA